MLDSKDESLMGFVQQSRVDLVGHGFEQMLQELPCRAPVNVFNALGDSMLACAVYADEEIVNRPGFTEERLVGMLGCFFIWVQGFIEHLLCVMRRDISGGALQALGVVPIDPL